MAKQIQPLSFPGPGSWGLNLEESRKEIDPRWAIKALNCVISGSGVIASRKGWKALNTALTGSPALEQMYEYIDSNNLTALISAADSKIYQGTTSLTDITGSITTPTENNWKFQNFRGRVVGWQEGHPPIVKNGSDSTATFSDISGTTSMPNGHDVLSAFGRLWATDNDRTTLRYSDLLNEAEWDSGSSGALDTYSVWTNGSDEITAIASFKDRLIIFGKAEILIYSGTEDPNNALALDDVIKGIGCVARDSVVNIGDDMLFLSDSGVHSLSRAIQGGDLPLNDVSVNVRDDLLKDLDVETPSTIRAVYSENEGFYLLTMPISNNTWVFDVAHRVPKVGLPRVLLWKGITPHSMVSVRDGALYLGQDGVVGEYGGGSSVEAFQDNGSSYRLEMKTGRTSADQGPIIKLLKYLKTSISGGFGQAVTAVWDLDYGSWEDSDVAQIQAGNPSYWEVATFEDSYWSSGLTTDELFYPLSGTGNNLSLEYRYTTDGSQLIIHNTEVFMKQGRLG